MGYVARQFADRRAVVAAGVLYAAGRAIAYALVGAAVVTAGARVSTAARGLQDIADIALGPLLVLVGLFMWGIISVPSSGTSGRRLNQLGENVAHRGGLGAFALGVLFALAFCPYSAALFFGVLIPMALSEDGGLVLPVAFGIGTSAPVLVLGIPLAMGIERTAGAVSAVGRSEVLVRKGVATVFVAVGVVLVLRASGGDAF